MYITSTTSFFLSNNINTIHYVKNSLPPVVAYAEDHLQAIVLFVP